MWSGTRSEEGTEIGGKAPRKYMWLQAIPLAGVLWGAVLDPICGLGFRNLAAA